MNVDIYFYDKKHVRIENVIMVETISSTFTVMFKVGVYDSYNELKYYSMNNIDYYVVTN